MQIASMSEVKLNLRTDKKKKKRFVNDKKNWQATLYFASKLVYNS